MDAAAIRRLQDHARTYMQHLDAVLKELIEIEKTAAEHSELTKDIYFRVMTQRLATIATLARGLAETLAIAGVLSDSMSRKLASELIGVHQATIARWVTDPQAITKAINSRIDERSPEKLAADERIDGNDDE